MNTNYSWQTSYNAYVDNATGKTRIADYIYDIIVKAANGYTCLKQLERITGLPQSTIAGRCNDLIEENKIEYNGFVEFENRKRKRIILKQLSGQLNIFG